MPRVWREHKKPQPQNRWAWASIVFLGVSWLLMGALTLTGWSSQPDSLLLNTCTALGVLTAPAAAILAIVGIFRDIKKPLAVAALALSLVTTVGIFYID